MEQSAFIFFKVKKKKRLQGYFPPMTILFGLYQYPWGQASVGLLTRGILMEKSESQCLNRSLYFAGKQSHVLS